MWPPRSYQGLPPSARPLLFFKHCAVRALFTIATQLAPSVIFVGKNKSVLSIDALDSQRDD